MRNLLGCQLKGGPWRAAFSRREEVNRNGLVGIQRKGRQQNNRRVHRHGGTGFGGNLLRRLRAGNTGAHPL